MILDGNTNEITTYQLDTTITNEFFQGNDGIDIIA